MVVQGQDCLLIVSSHVAHVSSSLTIVTLDALAWTAQCSPVRMVHTQLTRSPAQKLELITAYSDRHRHREAYSRVAIRPTLGRAAAMHKARLQRMARIQGLSCSIQHAKQNPK